MAFFKRNKNKQLVDKGDDSQQAAAASEEAEAPADESQAPEAMPEELAYDARKAEKEEVEPQEAPPTGDQPDKPGLWGRLGQRLKGTRDKIGGSIDRLTLGKKIDDEVLDELEEVLVTADLGVKTSLQLI